jgi:hypothetical protein
MWLGLKIIPGPSIFIAILYKDQDKKWGAHKRLNA